MSPVTAIDVAEFLGPSIALITAGGILSYSVLIAPLVRRAAASADAGSTVLALALLRMTFKIGAKIFPQLATLSAAFFGYLAVADAQASSGRRTGFALAAGGALSIIPFSASFPNATPADSLPSARLAAGATAIMFPPVNSRLIDYDERARRSSAGAAEVDGPKRTAEVLDLLKQFERLNVIRACLLGAGGLIGLWTALQT